MRRFLQIGRQSTKNVHNMSCEGRLGKVMKARRHHGNESTSVAEMMTLYGYRYLRWSGTRALKDIRKYQGSKNLLIPMLVFGRLVRSSTFDAVTARIKYRGELRSDLPDRIQKDALECLQEAVEVYVIQFLSSECITPVRCLF